MPFRVVASPAVEKQLRKAPAHVVRRVIAALPALAADPFTARPGLDVRRLEGGGAYRLRVGEWRILYAVDAQESLVLITSARPRRRAYRS